MNLAKFLRTPVLWNTSISKLERDKDSTKLVLIITVFMQSLVECIFKKQWTSGF